MFAKRFCLAAVVACFSPLLPAQMGMDAPTQAVGSAVSPARAQEALLNLFEHEVVSVAEAMPADKYNFAPKDGMISGSKYDGVRTFAQEVTHITGANYFFFASFGGPKPNVDMKALESLTDKQQIVDALKKSFAYAHSAIATITPANAYTAIKGVDGMNTRATVASFAVAHGYDHYGQMVEYLRMNGVIPPGSK